MRYNLKILYVIVFLSIIFAGFLFKANKLERLSDEDYIEPSTGVVRLLTKLYFVDKKILKVEDRYINFNNKDFPEQIAEEMRKGPKTKLFDDIFSGDIKLIDAKVMDSTCFVNLSSNFLNSEYWLSEYREYYIWSLVNTFTEVKGVKDVQILIDGNKVDAPVSDTNLIMPLTRRDEYIYVKKVYPSGVVIRFCDNVSNGRFDMAYNLLSNSLKRGITFKEFNIDMQEYRDSILGYERSVYFTQPENGNRMVYIKYDLIAEEEGIDRIKSKVEKWELIKENNIWKIKALPKFQ